MSDSDVADNDTPRELEVATLGGGCFWCLDAVFSELRGVSSVVSGYAGGHVPNPSYEMVCTDLTGHAEVVQISFDPKTIPFRDILDIFFTLHDPTTLNRQGADVGSQYRSIVFYHDNRQKSEAEAAIRKVNESGIWGKDAVTQLEPLTVFYPAEGYHQSYFKKNPYKPYCRVVIAPKVAKLRKEYLEKLR